MKEIWLKKIKELDDIIKDTLVKDVDLRKELQRKRDILEDVFNRVEK